MECQRYTCTVLFDISLLSTGIRQFGIGRYIVDLATSLEGQSGVRLLFLESAGYTRPPVITEDAAEAIANYFTPHRPYTDHKSWAYSFRLSAGRAVRYCAADVFHVPHSYATPLGDCGVKRIRTCHDLIPLRYPEHYTNWKVGFAWGRRQLDRRRYRWADHIVATSEATASDLTELLDIDRGKISVVHNGIDSARWLPHEEEGDLALLQSLGVAPRRYLVYVGSADWRKNHQGMLQALSILRHDYPDLKLVSVGRTSEHQRLRLKRLSREARVEDRLVLTGYLDDGVLNRLYRHALAALYVSYIEGFGLPIVEAMASGCAVITSDRSSMKEVADGAASLVPPDDATAIAAAIRDLAENSALRQDLGRLGRARAANFDRQRQAEQILDLYRFLTDG